MISTEVGERILPDMRYPNEAALAKLDSTTRQEAVATAARQGLLATR